MSPIILSEINNLEDMFVVPREKLKQITEHFVKELEKGTISHCSRNDRGGELTTNGNRSHSRRWEYRKSARHGAFRRRMNTNALFLSP